MAYRRVARGTDNNGLLLGDLAAGTRVGEFVIEAILGARGTGHIYKATHLVLPRRATIHVLPAADGPVRNVALDLLREACIVDAVDHPGMPRIFECGMLPDRRPWIASELIEGVTVAHLLETRRVSMSEVITIVRDVADILAESHRRGLVHCSVAPASIVIPAQPRRFALCLVDWDAALDLDAASPGVPDADAAIIELEAELPNFNGRISDPLIEIGSGSAPITSEFAATVSGEIGTNR